MRARSHSPPAKVLLFLALTVACSRAPSVESPRAPEQLPPEELPPEEFSQVWGGPPVWVESPMVKVRPGTEPGSRRELTLFAARNEFVSFQVAFHGGQTGMTIDSVSFPGLKGPGHITGSSLTLYRQAFIDITQPSTQHAKPGPWPDGLIPDVDELTGEKRLAFPFAVPPGEARALWVDVHVPQEARSGPYRGIVTVTTSEGASLELKIHLTVVDALMPSTPSLKTAFFLGPAFVCQAYAGKQECDEQRLLRLIPLFYRLGSEHRITLVGGFPRLSGRSPWSTQDWNTFELRWGPFLNGTAPSRLSGARLTSWQYQGSASADSLEGFTRETLARGWLPLAFDYVGDEPPYFATFDEVRRRATLTRQAAPELRTLLTSNIDSLEEENLEELVDILAVLINSKSPAALESGGQRERYERFLSQPNRELWLYQSCASHGCGGSLPENQPGQGWPSYMIDCSAAKVRAMEWVSFLEGASGELYYQTVQALDTAWTNQFRYSGNGDGTLFYAGTPSVIGGTTEVPLPSLRLKLIRLGIQDYEWLKAVSDVGDPGYARRVARWLIPAAWQVPDDGALFETARLCLMRRYLQLSGAPEPVEVPCPEGLGLPSEG